MVHKAVWGATLLALWSCSPSNSVQAAFLIGGSTSSLLLDSFLVFLQISLCAAGSVYIWQSRKALLSFVLKKLGKTDKSDKKANEIEQVSFNASSYYFDHVY